MLLQHANRWLRMADVRPVLTRDGLVLGGGLAGALAVQLAEEMEESLRDAVPAKDLPRLFNEPG